MQPASAIGKYYLMRPDAFKARAGQKYPASSWLCYTCHRLIRPWLSMIAAISGTLPGSSIVEGML